MPFAGMPKGLPNILYRW